MRLTLPALVVAVFMSGCSAVGPDFEIPSAKTADRWSETDVGTVAEAGEVDALWWQAFGDPVLDDLIARAYDNNLDLRIAGIRVLESQAQLGVAVGNLFPQDQRITGGAQWVRGSESAANTAGGDLRYADYDVGFSAGWELDLWGRFRRSVESADAALAASVADYDDVLVSLTAQVGRTYVTIRTIERRLAIARHNASLQRRSLEITDVRWRNGFTTELDVQQARTLVYDTESTIPGLEAALVQTENALAVLLDMLPGSVREVLGEARDIPAAPVNLVVGLPAELLQRRPDIRRRLADAASQSARIGVARADLFPSLTLFGTIGLTASAGSDTTGSGASGIDELLKGDALEMAGGPAVSWNILNYGRIKSAVRVEDARLQQLLVAYQREVLEAQREVEDALIGFVQGRAEVALLEKSVAAADRAVELALKQYRDGATDYVRVIDTQGSLLLEQDRLADRRGQVATDLIALYAALGGGWQMREGRPFVSEATREAMEARTNWGRLLDDDAAAAAAEHGARRKQWPHGRYQP